MLAAHFTTVANFIGIMLEQWEITLTVLVCLTVLFVGLFKGFKRAFVLALVFLFAAGLVFLGGAVAYLIQNDLQGLIAYAVAWVPTVIFVLILLVSTDRKSVV